MAQHFTEFWEAKGGTILETQVYNPKANDFSQPIKDLLNLEESKYRYRQLQQLLGSPLQFTERRRHDADALFLSTNPHTARSIYPQLRFYRATRLPVYAPPQIYSGQANPSQDLDLNSITFCDIPWLFSDAYQDELSLAALKDRGQSSLKAMVRAECFGVVASGMAETTISGYLRHHSRTWSPPMEPPTTESILFMPRWSISAFWAVTMSPMVTTGKSRPKGLPVFGLIEPGPVEPIQLPNMLEQTTKYLLVSIPLPGPTMISHQPGLASSLL
jgi:hypothetical protein